MKIKFKCLFGTYLHFQTLVQTPLSRAMSPIFLLPGRSVQRHLVRHSVRLHHDEEHVWLSSARLPRDTRRWLLAPSCGKQSNQHRQD